MPIPYALYDPSPMGMHGGRPRPTDGTGRRNGSFSMAAPNRNHKELKRIDGTVLPLLCRNINISGIRIFSRCHVNTVYETNFFILSKLHQQNLSLLLRRLQFHVEHRAYHQHR